jgi:hypothetical protein
MVPLGSRFSGTVWPLSERLKRWQFLLRASLSQYMIFQERSVLFSWNCGNRGQVGEWLHAIVNTPSTGARRAANERVQ